MKTVYIEEFKGIKVEDNYVLNLSETIIKDCCGCFSCWVKTPGICVHRDLDEFFHALLQADLVVFRLKPTCGFISGNLKSLFDRLIIEVLPYISYKTGESMHLSRYEKYPNIEIYYEDNFEYQEDKALFLEYLTRTFYQFRMPLMSTEALACGKENG